MDSNPDALLYSQGGEGFSIMKSSGERELHSFKPPTLGSAITTWLRDAILKGEFQPGDRMVESTLARKLQVSQGVVREAIHALEHQGLLQKIPNKGTFVVKFTIEDYAQVHQVRLALETLAVELAKENAGVDEVSALEEYVEQMKRAASRNDLYEFFKGDLGFHQCIYRLSGNIHLEKALNTVVLPELSFALLRALPSNSFNWHEVAADHEAFLRTFRAGSTGAARKAAVSLMTKYFRQIHSFLRRRADKEHAPVGSLANSL